MTREDRAYSFLTKLTSGIFPKDKLKLEESKDIILGAIAGTALGAFSLAVLTTKPMKQLIEDKKALDATYSPIQKLLAEEIEEVNRKIVLSKYVGKAIGSGGAIFHSMSSPSPKFGMRVGASIGAFLGSKMASLIMSKEKEHLSQLMMEYDNTLSNNQKILREKVRLASEKLGLVWTLGITGGALAGSYIKMK